MNDLYFTTFRFENGLKKVRFSESRMSQDHLDLKEEVITIHINLDDLHEAILEIKKKSFGGLFAGIRTAWALLDLRFWRNDKSRDFAFLQAFGVIKMGSNTILKLSDFIKFQCEPTFSLSGSPPKLDATALKAIQEEKN